MGSKDPCFWVNKQTEESLKVNRALAFHLEPVDLRVLRSGTLGAQ